MAPDGVSFGVQKLAWQGRWRHIWPVSEQEQQQSGRGAIAAPDGANDMRLCDHDGCGLLGAYRAPQAREALRSYYWFCLEHIRAYNAAWNFYSGMSEDEVERERRADTVWHRPSWPFGKMPAAEIDDPLGLLGKAFSRKTSAAPAHVLTPEDRRALSVLNLEMPTDRAEIKQRYKELVKKHHPDVNGGNRKAEEKLKAINQAYSQLMGSFTA